MARLARASIGVLAAIGVLAILAASGFVVVGVSAQGDPPVFEATLARSVRHLLIPRAARTRTNPMDLSDELREEGMEHWADHCASCHGNDGKGATAIGSKLYPRAPDMTLPATQDLSDGELFWIIENGIKLTGMPAWGSPSPEDDADSWELVHFIRHLPEIAGEELRTMERLNPVSREDVERQLEIERFLAGESSAQPEREREGHQH